MNVLSYFKLIIDLIIAPFRKKEEQTIDNNQNEIEKDLKSIIK